MPVSAAPGGSFASLEFPVREATRKIFPVTEEFASRHIGPSAADVKVMLSAVGCETMEDLVSQTIPANIRLERPLELPTGRPEGEMLVRRAVCASHCLPRTVCTPPTGVCF